MILDASIRFMYTCTHKMYYVYNVCTYTTLHEMCPDTHLHIVMKPHIPHAFSRPTSASDWRPNEFHGELSSGMFLSKDYLVNLIPSGPLKRQRSPHP